MSQVSDSDVEAIKQWLSQEPSLPNDFDDLVIKKFLYSCNCSLERTKKCIDDFCTKRRNMPETFTDRDPLSTKMQDAFTLASTTSYIANSEEMIIYTLKQLSTEKFNFYDMIKSFMLIIDDYINEPRDVLPENQILIFDIKPVTLSILPKIDISYYKKFLGLALDAMPLRLKSMHVINCPSFYEIFYNLLKPALPKDICNVLHFHSNHTALYEFLDKTYLPSEYGGDAESMDAQFDRRIKKICDHRKWFLDDEVWKADISKKITTPESAMNGSFRTLSID